MAEQYFLEGSLGARDILIANNSFNSVGSSFSLLSLFFPQILLLGYDFKNLDRSDMYGSIMTIVKVRDK